MENQIIKQKTLEPFFLLSDPAELKKSSPERTLWVTERQGDYICVWTDGDDDMDLLPKFSLGYGTWDWAVA